MALDKKVLIIGTSANAYSLAKKFTGYGCKLFVAPGNLAISEFAQCIDIREDNIQELLEFAVSEEIDLTVVVSDLAIKNNIAELFQINGQLIFAPTAQSSNFVLSKSIAKKFLYKLRIPTPRFAIFDKLPLAVDYLKTAQMPQVIKTDETRNSNDRLVCSTFSSAKTFVEDLFAKDEKKVVLEDYVYGHEFSLYIITDGYHAIPLVNVANYKFMEDGDGGILTSGIGAFTPDYKISYDLQDYLMSNVVNVVLEELQQRGTPYLGILGINCVLDENGQFVVLDFNPFLSDHDSDAVLNLIEENLFTLFQACAIGSFADDYDSIKISDDSSVSCVISSRTDGSVIKGLEYIDSDISHFGIKKNKYLEYESIKGKNFVLTHTAKTLSRARKYLYESVDLISFDGKKYRTDICEQVDNF